MQAHLFPLPAAAGFLLPGRTVIARGAGRLLPLLLVLAALLLGGCVGGGGGPAAVPLDQAEVAALERAIRGLGPQVDPEEASRAARIAYEYPRQLAREYGVTDPPLIHNTKVNMGLRPRGLCWHWAEDMQKRLGEEEFKTLSLHRAIATPETPFGGDHSTLIVSRRGDGIYEGIVLDPWRRGGLLYWAPTREDPDYAWRSQAVVHNEKRLRRVRERSARTR